MGLTINQENGARIVGYNCQLTHVVINCVKCGSKHKEQWAGSAHTITLKDSDLICFSCRDLETTKAVEILKPIYPAIYERVLELIAEDNGLK